MGEGVRREEGGERSFNVSEEKGKRRVVKRGKWRREGRER